VENLRYWATLDEYQNTLKKIRLERRLKIMVEEPDTESYFHFAWYQRKYETHHKVQIKDEAISGRRTTVYYQSFSTRLLI
jgi:ATP-dependent Clp protease ATP-binding subunit ClpA